MKKLLIVVALVFIGCGAAVKEAKTNDGGAVSASPTLMMLPGEIVHDPGPYTPIPPPPPPPTH